MQEELLIPKHRFDEVNEERKKLEQEVEALREAVKEADNYRSEIKKLKLENALDKVLAEASAINPDTVKPLINLPDEYDDDCIFGLIKEQVGKLAADDDTAFLFKTEQKLGLKGCTPDEGCDGLQEQPVVGLDAAIEKHLIL